MVVLICRVTRCRPTLTSISVDSVRSPSSGEPSGFFAPRLQAHQCLDHAAAHGGDVDG